MCMIEEKLIQLTNKEGLTEEEAKLVMDEMMEGKASDVQIAAYLTALAIGGETIDIIKGSARSMREHCQMLSSDKELLEIVGTGGDHSNSFNISTTSAIVLAAGGVSIAKHGNRASSSLCGSADVLEALGIHIFTTPEQNKKILEEINICFLFAQTYHTAMKYVASVRRELRFRTIFNVLGPLSNPAQATLQIMGVYEESLLEPLAIVLRDLGVKRAMVVYGMNQLDEISISAETKVCELKDGEFLFYEITPEDFGYTRCKEFEIVGGLPKQNAEIIKRFHKKNFPRREECL